MNKKPTLLFATPGGDENHPWARRFLEALRKRFAVTYCAAELSDSERERAIQTVPADTPIMQRIMAERSQLGAEIRAQHVAEKFSTSSNCWLHLQLYTNDVLPPQRLHAVYTDIFLGNVAERADALPGMTWNTDFLAQALQREKSMLESCRRVYVTSQWVAEYGRKQLGLGERIVYAGVGPVVTPEKPPPPRDSSLPPRLLFIGNDGERKGLDVVLEVFSRIRARRPETELAVVGRAEVNSDLPIIRHGFIDACTEAGKARLSEILSDANLFLLPTRFDPVGIAFLDAMSHGLPIIGPRDCMVPEYLEDGLTGRFIHRNADDITRVVLECLDNPVGCVEMGRRALAVQQREYRWDLVSERILVDWQKVCDAEATHDG